MKGMVMIPAPDLQEVRLRQVENVLSSLMEGQSNLAQIMTEQARHAENMESRMTSMETRMTSMETRMSSLETRLQRVEHNQTLIMDDLAFIKEILMKDR